MLSRIMLGRRNQLPVHVHCPGQNLSDVTTNITIGVAPTRRPKMTLHKDYWTTDAPDRSIMTSVIANQEGIRILFRAIAASGDNRLRRCADNRSGAGSSGPEFNRVGLARASRRTVT